MNKKNKKSKRKHEKINVGIIHNQNSIYTYKVKNKDGKRQNKNSCVYYDKSTMKCNNKKCSKSICTTAHNCTSYKRIKSKIIKNECLSPYDESYIQLPYKPSVHESDNMGLYMSHNIGVPNIVYTLCFISFSLLHIVCPRIDYFGFFDIEYT